MIFAAQEYLSCREWLDGHDRTADAFFSTYLSRLYCRWQGIPAYGLCLVCMYVLCCGRSLGALRKEADLYAHGTLNTGCLCRGHIRCRRCTRRRRATTG